MKIAVIGAAGVRTPLLVRGLAEIAADLGLERVALFDPDRERLAPIARLAAAVAAARGWAPAVAIAARAEAAVEGADFVVTSLRAGGIAARARDEAIALAHGLVGQETVGAGGWACALRNLQPMLAYARLLGARAPRARLINFTNPVGIVSQALLAAGAPVLGVCDTPLETFEQIAAALGRDPFTLDFDYVGLNHLGWITGVRERDGARRELLPALLASPDAMRRCYRHGLFPPEFIQRLGLLPTEYLYFYYFPERARAQTARSGESRGAVLERLNRDLFRRLAEAAEGDLIGIYEAYLRERNATYFSIEATGGSAREDARPLYSRFSGYERIAVLLLSALHSAAPQVVPLTVPNDGAIAGLEPGDAVELPCAVSRAGVVPARPGAAPAAVRELLVAVKRYERLVAAAALHADRGAARLALEANPLVGPDAAPAVFAAYEREFGSALGL